MELYASIKSNNGLCCSASLFESYGYSIMESQMAELDMIAYNVGPIEKLSSNKLHLIAIGDVNGFKDKIEELTKFKL